MYYNLWFSVWNEINQVEKIKKEAKEEREGIVKKYVG